MSGPSANEMYGNNREYKKILDLEQSRNRRWKKEATDGKVVTIITYGSSKNAVGSNPVSAQRF